MLRTESSVVPPTSPVTPATRAGEVRLEAVDFTYPGAGAPVLRDITLRAVPGTTTAIIGSTGAGKTTLLSLIPRLFDATAGAVLVDGVDVRDYDLDVLWDRIGLVPQKPFLFTGTVASNLRYGNPDATDEELWAALTMAQARASSRPCRTAWSRRSPRAGRTSPAASGNGWPSRGRWWRNRASTCSTTRSRRWTSPPTPGCGRRSGR